MIIFQPLTSQFPRVPSPCETIWIGNHWNFNRIWALEFQSNLSLYHANEIYKKNFLETSRHMHTYLFIIIVGWSGLISYPCSPSPHPHPLVYISSEGGGVFISLSAKINNQDVTKWSEHEHPISKCHIKKLIWPGERN